MKAIKYKVKVYEGVLAWTHGWKKEIEEIFIPKEKIAFSLGDGSLYIFRCEKPRGEGKEIELEDFFVYRLVEHLKKFEELQKEVEIVFKDERDKN